MDDKDALTMDQIREELTHFPASVLEEFETGLKSMPDTMTAEQTVDWAKSGLEIAQQTVRSWEAAAQFFKVSPEVVGFMPFNYFVRWNECGADLCKESPTLAAAYFEASPGTMATLRSRHIQSWANLGGGLYKGTWKSSTLACKFFLSSPELLNSLTFPEVERFAAFLDALSHRSYDLAAECLTLGQQLFPLVGDDKGAFISLATTLVETGWREVKSFFEAGARSLPRVESDQRLRFLKLAEALVQKGGVNIPTMMLEMSQSLAETESHAHAHILDLADALIRQEPAAVPDFIKSVPTALEKITMNQLDKWFEQGMEIMDANRDGGLAFFKIESSRSETALETLSSAVEYGRVKDVMEMYCRALAGAEIKLSETGDLVEKNIGWVSNESPSTEGSTVFVPSLVDQYPSKEENYALFKVVSTHQVAHLEFGSFFFEFDRPSELFNDLRTELEQKKVQRTQEAAEMPDVDPSSLEQGWITDMQRYFNMFEDRKLSLDIYTVVEDARLDARVKVEYPGIRNSYQSIQTDSLEKRPDIMEMPAREAMVEFLVRLSLQQYKDLPAPNQYVDEAKQLASILKQITKPEAAVEDTAEASLRIYAIISAIPNEEIPPEEWENMDMDQEEDEEYADPEDMEQLLQQMALGMEMELRPDGEEDYDSSEEVDYRGDFKPELAQLLTQLRMQQQDQMSQSGGEQITQEQLEEMLQNSAELDLQAVQGEVDESSGMFANNLLKEAGMEMPQSPEFGQGPLVHVDEDGGELEPSEPETFVYDEWDFRADDYKPRWCIVKQKMMPEGDPTYFANTLSNYGGLVTQIKRQFEMMVPEMMRKVRRLEDGEEFDIDDVIEAMVDIRTGSSPSDKFYWRRNKVQRDVAVAFLLDTSASTAEAIDDAKKAPDDWDAPDDPVEYMVWLRTRRGEAMRRSYKRIIDVEKEAMVLLINAMEAIGDVYGIYGFSGYGRENVEFYTVKDLDENFNEKVKKRIDRIAPLHATRMGPAIRHTTTKLDKQDARTKLMFLISDGRPQDRGYSREGVEKEYAVHDTRMALNEAAAKGISTFALTVDKNGHDYLQTMCADMGYEVLDDIYALPQRLLYLYKRLTM